LLNCETAFDLTEREKRIAELEARMREADFWGDERNAQRTIDELNGHRALISDWGKLKQELDDLAVLLELAEEEDDSAALSEVEEGLERLEKEIEELEFKNMFDEEDDRKDAILTLHPGAGGTESTDWAQMLLRMYLRWIERHHFQSEILDLQPGDEAGIKSATVEVKGEYAYGYLKAEAGVHRLVRISPFDSQSRRHTSFVSVFVYPEIDEAVEVKINDNDLRIDTFRASGPGGQYVNKTESAVRITHIPTGIVVQCQSERSQHQNRINAMKILVARLYQLYKEEQQKRLEEVETRKRKIEWGSQIRSYILQPYSLVKDHRTNTETGNVQAVLDGDIDQFIRSYLTQVKND